MQRVQIIHWRPVEAAPLIDHVRRAGYDVRYCEDPGGAALTQAIRDNMPEAVVIDLSRLPSHGKEIAVWLRGRKSTRSLPIVFVGGDPGKRSKLQELLPDAAFTDQSNLASVLVSSLTPHPLETAQPVVPAQMMQRYANRTAAQKMGIRERTKVGVVNPPRDFHAVLGDMPSGAELIENPDSALDVTLWFVHEPETFFAALTQMRNIAPRTKLWVLWRKGSGNGITQDFIRESAIDAGLVDYKICSVDGCWSGIAFALRKASAAQ